MSAINQTWAVTTMNLRAMTQRMGTAAVSVVGIAGVVMIFVAVLSIGEGFRRTLELAGSDQVAIVLRGGTTSELSSSFSQEQVQIIKQASGIARRDAVPIVSAELFVTVDQPRRSTGTFANAPLRGIEPAAVFTHPHFKLVSGRMFATGHNEIIVGRAVQRSLAGIDSGATLKWGNNRWVVVGVFEDDGSVAESELWTDAQVLQGAYDRGSSFQSVRAWLESPATFTAFKDQLTTDPRLNVNVLTEKQFYAEQSSGITTIIRTAGGVLALLMGIGAVFGALNTMYSAVVTRTSEIATLRALGFGALPVVVSVLVESALLGLIGGVLGAAIAYLLCNGYQASTLNYASFSQVSFAFSVGPRLLLTGIVYALLLGFVGGLFPAVRAARMPVIQGLREG